MISGIISSMNHRQRETENLWVVLQDAVDGKKGGCIPWTELAIKVLSTSNIGDSIIPHSGLYEAGFGGGMVHLWVEGKVPKEGIVEVDGDIVNEIIQAEAIRRGVLDFPSVEGKTLVGYISGKEGAKAIMDGTISQFWFMSQREFSRGLYGIIDDAPYELREMYDRGTPFIYHDGERTDR